MTVDDQFIFNIMLMGWFVASQLRIQLCLKRNPYSYRCNGSYPNRQINAVVYECIWIIGGHLILKFKNGPEAINMSDVVSIFLWIVRMIQSQMAFGTESYKYRAADMYGNFRIIRFL